MIKNNYHYHLIKNKKFLFLVIVGFIISISFVSSQTDTFGEFNRFEKINLWQNCDCTYVNLTSILYQGKNATSVSFPVVMTKTGTYFNYTLDGLKNYGIYTVTGVGNPQGITTTFSSTFEIIPRKENVLYLDLKDSLTKHLVVAFFIIAVIMLMFRMFFISGTIFIVGGLILAINSFNPIVSFGIVGLGVSISSIR